MSNKEENYIIRAGNMTIKGADENSKKIIKETVEEINLEDRKSREKERKAKEIERKANKKTEETEKLLEELKIKKLEGLDENELIEEQEKINTYFDTFDTLRLQDINNEDLKKKISEIKKELGGFNKEIKSLLKEKQRKESKKQKDTHKKASTAKKTETEETSDSKAGKGTEGKKEREEETEEEKKEKESSCELKVRKKDLLDLKEAIEKNRIIFSGKELNSYAIDGIVNSLLENNEGNEDNEDIDIDNYPEIIKALEIVKENKDINKIKKEEEKWKQIKNNFEEMISCYKTTDDKEKAIEKARDRIKKLEKQKDYENYKPMLKNHNLDQSNENAEKVFNMHLEVFKNFIKEMEEKSEYSKENKEKEISTDTEKGEEQLKTHNKKASEESSEESKKQSDSSKEIQEETQSETEEIPDIKGKEEIEKMSLEELNVEIDKMKKFLDNINSEAEAREIDIYENDEYQKYNEYLYSLKKSENEKNNTEKEKEENELSDQKSKENTESKDGEKNGQDKDINETEEEEKEVEEKEKEVEEKEKEKEVEEKEKEKEKTEELIEKEVVVGDFEKKEEDAQNELAGFSEEDRKLAIKFDSGEELTKEEEKIAMEIKTVKELVKVTTIDAIHARMATVVYGRDYDESIKELKILKGKLNAELVINRLELFESEKKLNEAMTEFIKVKTEKIKEEKKTATKRVQGVFKKLTEKISQAKKNIKIEENGEEKSEAINKYSVAATKRVQGVFKKLTEKISQAKLYKLNRKIKKMDQKNVAEVFDSILKNIPVLDNKDNKNDFNKNVLDNFQSENYEKIKKYCEKEIKELKEGKEKDTLVKFFNKIIKIAEEYENKKNIN